jgi:ribosome-binding factor A
MKQPKPYPRAERVRTELRHVLAEEVERMRDDLGFVTITEVTLTPDLRHAKAYFTILEEGKKHEKVRKAMTAATTHLRTTLARSVRLKFAPTLEMIEDPVPEQARHIDELLRKLHEGER